MSHILTKLTLLKLLTYLLIPRPTCSHKQCLINVKPRLRFWYISGYLIWEKMDQALSPPPPCYSFGDSQATPDGVLLFDIALEKLQQTKAVMSGFCCASSPFPPCSSQGRKVLRWKLRDARPPATTCSLPQPSAINSPPSKLHPALSDSYCGKSAPSLPEHLQKISSSWKRSLGLSQRTWKIFPKPATPHSAARRFPSLFQPHVGKMTFSSAPQFPLNLSKWRDSSLVIQ